MNEREIAKKLTGYLDKGAAGLKSGVIYRLQLARAQALARAAEPRRAAELALAGSGGRSFGGRRHLLLDARLWVGILLLAGGLVYFQHWHSLQQARELADTDAAILSSDLPIEAYLDRGFQNWLAHSEP
jgi:Protein of unknown function (DUF3619)